MRTTGREIDIQAPIFEDYVKIVKTGEIGRFLGWNFSTNIFTVELPGGGIAQFHRRELAASRPETTLGLK